jgi:hypothetical protein
VRFIVFGSDSGAAVSCERHYVGIISYFALNWCGYLAPYSFRLRRILNLTASSLLARRTVG